MQSHVMRRALRVTTVVYAVAITAALVVGALDARQTFAEMTDRIDALERDVRDQNAAHHEVVKRVDTGDQATVVVLEEIRRVSKAVGASRTLSLDSVTERLDRTEDRLDQLDARIGAVGRDVSALYRYVPGFQAQENGGWNY